MFVGAPTDLLPLASHMCASPLPLPHPHDRAEADPPGLDVLDWYEAPDKVLRGRSLHRASKLLRRRSRAPARDRATNITDSATVGIQTDHDDSAFLADERDKAVTAAATLQQQVDQMVQIQQGHQRQLLVQEQLVQKQQAMMQEMLLRLQQKQK